MTATPHDDRSETVLTRARRWLPLALRAGIAPVLVAAAVVKVANYGHRVDSFASHGIPAPEVMVPLVALVELAAAVSIGLGIAGRLGAAVVLPVMVTAMVTVRVGPLNVFVLVGCLGIVLLGTGRYSLWDPELGFGNRSGNG